MTLDLFPTAFSHWDREERAAIARVHASGRYTMAHETEAFEHELAQYHRRKHAIAVNSGSSANLVAVGALLNLNIIQEHAQVAVPALAWATTYAPLVQLGLRIERVIDCDDTWNAFPPDGMIDLTVGCSILGNPAYLDDIESDARTVLLEDNCESLGGHTEAGRPLGTFGIASTESFFYSHQLSAIEGGVILTDDDDFARTCRLLRNHGNAGWGEVGFDDLYNFEIFGYNLRPLELHCAIAREQLKKLDDFIAERRANLINFKSLTEHLPIIFPRENGYASPFGLAFRVESQAARTRLVAALRAANIDARPPTGGSFTQHVYGAPWRDTQPTPNADLIHDTGLFLGNAPYPIPHLIERAARVLKETL